MTTKVKKPKTKTNVIAPMSVQEFKMWIRGLSDFQDENWAPNKTQWEHIRMLIDNLNDTISTPQTKSPSTQQQPVRQPITPMGEAVVLEDNISNPPAQPRFHSINQNSARSIAEYDESGNPILKSVYESGSEFA